MSRYPFFSLTGIVCGAVSAFAGFISRTSFGSPLDMIHKISGKCALPSIWVFNLVSIAFFFVIGLAFGWVAETTADRMNVGREEVSAYRGAMFLIAAFFLSLIWYPVFMFAQKLFLSLVISILCMLSSLLCAVEWGRVFLKRASVAMLINTLWCFYIMFISLSVFLNS